MKKTKRLTAAAMLTALGTALVCGAAFVPRGALALVALAGLLPAAVVIECGLGWSVLHYLAVGLLSLLLAPDKLLALWYVFVFGHYGIFKSLIERLRQRWLQALCKLAVFGGAMGLFYALFSGAFTAFLPSLGAGVLAAVLLAAFVLYDFAFSCLIGVYLKRIHRAV